MIGSFGARWGEPCFETHTGARPVGGDPLEMAREKVARVVKIFFTRLYHNHTRRGPIFDLRVALQN